MPGIQSQYWQRLTFPDRCYVTGEVPREAPRISAWTTSLVPLETWLSDYEGVRSEFAGSGIMPEETSHAEVTVPQTDADPLISGKLWL